MNHYLEGMPLLSNPMPKETRHVWALAKTGDLFLTDNGIYGAVLYGVSFHNDTVVRHGFIPRNECVYIGVL